MTKMVEVTQEDANNYCRVLTALGMEEEGDPVAEIERLRLKCSEHRDGRLAALEKNAVLVSVLNELLACEDDRQPNWEERINAAFVAGRMAVLGPNVGGNRLAPTQEQR